jgi:hypothetical protein
MTRNFKMIVSGFFLALLICIPTLVSHAQDTTRQAPPPEIKINPASKARISFISDIWDFGSIPKGGVVTHAFNFKNNGTDTLEVTNVKPTCGCTLAPLSNSHIAPGDQASIKATFNTQKFNGRVSKQIYVDSNDPINPYLKVSFSAIINNPLQTIVPSPAEADFDTIKAGTPTKIKITITNTDTSPAELVMVEQADAANVNASLSTRKLAPKQSADLVLELSPKAMPNQIANAPKTEGAISNEVSEKTSPTNTGEYKTSITIEASNIPGSRFTIPIKAMIIQ